MKVVARGIPGSIRDFIQGIRVERWSRFGGGLLLARFEQSFPQEVGGVADLIGLEFSDRERAGFFHQRIIGSEASRSDNGASIRKAGRFGSGRGQSKRDRREPAADQKML